VFNINFTTLLVDVKVIFQETKFRATFTTKKIYASQSTELLVNKIKSFTFNIPIDPTLQKVYLNGFTACGQFLQKAYKK
jgi:hypothetical protein